MFFGADVGCPEPQPHPHRLSVSFPDAVPHIRHPAIWPTPSVSRTCTCKLSTEWQFFSYAVPSLQASTTCRREPAIANHLKTARACSSRQDGSKALYTYPRGSFTRLTVGVNCHYNPCLPCNFAMLLSTDLLRKFQMMEPIMKHMRI